MFEKTVWRLIVSRSQFTAASVSVMLCAAAVSGCASRAAGQVIKATVAAAPIESTSLSQWSRDLNYQQTELYPLTLDRLGCPVVDVDVSGVKVSVTLDSGTSTGFVITNHAPSIPYRIEGRHEEFNADGSHRGESFGIRVETMSVLDELRESPVSRGPGFDRPVALALGSDVLSRFVVTINIRAKKLILALAQ